MTNKKEVGYLKAIESMSGRLAGLLEETAETVTLVNLDTSHEKNGIVLDCEKATKKMESQQRNIDRLIYMLKYIAYGHNKCNFCRNGDNCVLPPTVPCSRFRPDLESTKRQ